MVLPLIRRRGRSRGTLVPLLASLPLTLVLVTAWASPVTATEPPGSLSKEAVERIVREYLLANPDVIVEALRGLEERQRADERQRTSLAIRAHRDELLADPDAPVGGNPQGDVTIVEFFDYRCGYCKRVAPTVTQVLRNDGQLRIVYKELPVLGPESTLAARAALAAHGQGKYMALHEALMAASGPLTPDAIMTIAGQVGVDTAKLQEDMQSPEITARLQRNHVLARALGVRGTPAFVIGDELVPGAVDLATITRLVEQARAR